MTETLTSAQVPPVAGSASAARTSLWRRLVKNPLGVASLAFLVLVALLAALAPVLAPTDPAVPSAVDVLAPPGGDYLLGADGSGRDILSRLLYASRLSLLGGLLALTVAAALGITSGLVAGYYSRWFETVSSWVAGLLQALPGIVVLLAARAVLGPSIWTSMVIFGILLSPAFYRVVSAAVSGVRHELYVDAARVSGLSDERIIARHVLTVVRAPAIILAAGIAAIVIAIQAGLDFLGLGDPTRPTWGGMLSDAFANIYRAPLMLLWPSLAIGLTCIALALLGNALRDVLERTSTPKKRRRGAAPATVEVRSEPVVVHDELPGTGSGEELLHVDGLSIGYDQPDGSLTTVVEDVDLTVRRGEVHGLVGESGSGKTQTAWSILRLLPPGGRMVSGAIEFEGEDLAKLSEKAMTRLRGRRIAYIPQEPMSNLDPAFSIGHQLTEPMRVALGISRAEAKGRALDLLARVGITDPQRTFAAYPHEISGGMAQRVLIAGAVSCNPDLLIADEPTTALDVTVQAEVLDLLRDLQSEFHMGVLLVTHNFGVVADLCDRVSVMRNGRIVETGPARSIFADPRHAYTRSLFAAVLEDAEPRGELTTVPVATREGAHS
ncbi:MULTISPECIES: dipeptide/oligopeptide/nickel ABC transporter permease/ATP-binding protein [Modestobacter]|jgi:peptide/nickel transport system permease protein|uniref:ABC transporter n=1 Tax=Modestobacter caceresii TaxID=1522368 RepID=A0A098YAN1_9ACTN|nr:MULTISPECIES: dipeptide/oligopeptide/nickel ABC transporter permease/ATP-binding protein [Modestobacter]KGH46791.1 ABC transporter [Modestobacter caceresii]